MTGASEWTGGVGDAWAAEWRRTDRSFADLSRQLDAAILEAAPSAPFRALDIGCGAGGTTLALAAARADATITGLDISPELVAVARQRARDAGVLGRDAVDAGPDPEIASGSHQAAEVAFIVGDAPRTAPAYGPFDLLYSRHGVMFFDDPVAAFAALRGAAAPGARLVFSCFRAMADNEWAVALIEAAGGRIEAALPEPEPEPGPFAFADRERVARILTQAGWRDATAAATDYVYHAGGGPDPVADALQFISRIGPAARVLQSGNPAEREAATARMVTVLARQRRGDSIDFPAAAWIWSATA